MSRRHVFAVLRIALLAIAAVYAVGGNSVVPSAGAASGAAGAVTVTVLPTVGLSDGQAINVHATGASGTLIFEIAAHICSPKAGVNNHYNFGFQGRFCTNVAPGAGDVEKKAATPEGVREADLTGFKVGSGVTKWTDEIGVDHTLTCGPSSTCDVVIRVEHSGGTAFFTAPLCFGKACPAEPGGAPAPPVVTPQSTGSGTAPGSGGSAASGDGAAAGSASAKAADAATAGSATTDAQGTVAKEATKRAGAQVQVALDEAEENRQVRVYAAGIVGVLGGARAVQISSKFGRRSGAAKPT